MHGALFEGAVSLLQFLCVRLPSSHGASFPSPPPPVIHHTLGEPSVLRALLLYLSKAIWARRMVTGLRFARRTASRFVAGDTLEEAIQAVQRLNDQGLVTTLDHLGKDVTNAEKAIKATDDYIRLLEQIHACGCRSNASLKLTQLGLNLDYDLCLGNMRCVALRAKELDIYLRIDMEDSSTIDSTLSIFRTLREEDFNNIGLVFQSYMYRSEDDTREVLEKDARIRLVKGAYKEPPDIAYQKKRDVDSNFDRLTDIILDYAASHGAEPISADGRIPPVAAIATHDETRIDYAAQYAERIGLPKSALEFQMLYGIRTDLQRSLAQAGYPVRVYVAYGTEWYPFFMRRLAERPANLWFLISNLLRG